MIEREPVTVILSKMGWIRAMKGHQPLDAEVKFRDGDGPLMALHAETTDKLVVYGANGRFYTLPVNGLPGGRGLGEPLRLMIDLPNDAEVIDMFPWRADAQFLVASRAGDGFIVNAGDILAQTRAGKQVLNGELLAMLRVTGDHVATIGDNIKTLIFPLAELPEMGRGKGVKLQSFKQGGLADITVFNAENGPEWADGGGRRRNWPDWKDWLGKRAGAGRQGPRGLRKFR